jgi:hypothetical protein
MTPDSIFRAKQGAADLIGSGTIILLESQPIEIGIPIQNEVGMTPENLTLRITLKKDDADKSSRWGVQTFPDNPKLIELIILNLDSPLGGGPPNPIPLWRNADDSSIVLMLRVQTQTDYPPIIHFSFYHKKPEVKS